jgi:hypothetical protein
MAAEQYPDVEGALRTWLRGQATITALVGQRVFFGVPRKANEASFPMIVVRRVGGTDDGSEAPVDRALIQFDAWGSLDASGNGDKAAATTLVNTLRALFFTVRGRTALTATVAAFGITVVGGPLWLPDPDNDRPRYVVTAEVTAIST